MRIKLPTTPSLIKLHFPAGDKWRAVLAGSKEIELIGQQSEIQLPVQAAASCPGPAA